MLAQKLDDGDLTNAEFARQTTQIDDKIDEIGFGVISGMVEGSAQKTQHAISAREAETEFQRIEEEFPVTKVLRSDAFQEFLPAAREKLAADGITLTPNAKGTLPLDQRVALSRAVAPLAQAKYGPLLKSGTESEDAGAAAAAAAGQAEAGGEAGAGGTGAAKKPPLPPDIRETGEVKLGIVEGGLSDKTVLELVDNEDALERLIRENPKEAERYAIGG